MKPVFKFNGDFDELSYPFIYEQSSLCDFEILTDELCTLTGLAGSACQARDADIHAVLFDLQPLIFDLNASVRTQCTIEQGHIETVKGWLHLLKEKQEGSDAHFVLPRGRGAVILLHSARSVSKKAIRALVRVQMEGIEVPEPLPRFTNVLTNLFFRMTQIINQRDGEVEPVFVSRNYPNK